MTGSLSDETGSEQFITPGVNDSCQVIYLAGSEKRLKEAIELV